ncbi:MAG: TIM barrel protein [Actinomycetales bacterium]|nr:TIM barrel protein [Actinomycetales bacterium]
MSDFLQRIASAPISWGICEVPGWGAMLPTDRVLSEMNSLGLPATELGAPGFLPDSPDELRQTLGAYDMSLIGGFTPFVLHDPAQRDAAIAEAHRVASLFQRCGATHVVSAVVMDDQWSVPRPLDAAEQRHLLHMLGVIDEICGEYGLQQVLHPHVQTVVETRDDIHRVLDGCDVQWCLDTGHLAIGGEDPVEFARQAADRVGHVHLKDVNLDLAPGLLRREYSIMQGVQRSLFTPLGQGDVPIADVIEVLEGSGYRGWYVIEQDTAILGDPPQEGAGPVTSVAQSMDYLREVVAPRLAQA